MFSEAAVEIEAGRVGLPDDTILYPAYSVFCLMKRQSSEPREELSLRLKVRQVL